MHELLQASLPDMAGAKASIDLAAAGLISSLDLPLAGS